jgi:RNA polymerase sigma-70 factor (ECF subfamily)
LRDPREAEPEVTGGDAEREAASDRQLDPSAPDELLAAEAAAGRREAFDLLVERHRRGVYQLSYRFTGNHADAADLSQEVFVRAYRAIGHFRRDSSFGTWLYRIAVNAGLTRAAASRPAPAPLEAARHVPADVDPPDESVIREERRRLVKAAVGALPPRQRATLILRVYHGMSLEEIAQVLGRSVGTVKANLFFALRNLKTSLTGDR